MAGPSITLSLVDPGAAKNPVDSSQIPVYVDIAEGGSLTEVKTFTKSAAIETEYTRGVLVDAGKNHLAAGNNEVKLLRVAATTAGVASGADIGGALLSTVTGTPTQFLSVTIEIVTVGAGAISGGDYVCRYSLDDWSIPNISKTWSPNVTVPASGAVPLSGTGLTANLVTAASPSALDTASFTTTPGEYDAAAITAARTQLIHATAGIFTFVCYGEYSTAALANTAAAAVEAELLAMFGLAKFVGALSGGGLGADSTVVTAFASAESSPPFLSIGYGMVYVTNPTSQIARGRIGLRQHHVASAEIAGMLVSTDPARTANGALSRVVGTDYDAADEGDTLHDARISVMRTWLPASQGIFIQRQRLLSAAISNFTTWPHAAVMLEALKAAHRVAFLIVADTLRKNSDSTMDARDRKDLESACNAELKRVLLDPLNVRGNPGHVTTATAEVNSATLLPAVDIDIRLGSHEWPDDVTMTLQYA
jgi:hypothetical protein